MQLSYGLAHESDKLIWSNLRKLAQDIANLPQSRCLDMGRNDWSACQLWLCGDQPYTVNIADTPWISHRLHSVHIRVEVVCDLPVETCLVGMIGDDERTMKADILLSQTAIEREAFYPQAVWVEVKTAEDTAPGLYHGCIRLYESQGLLGEQCVAQLAFDVKVHDMRLDSPQENPFRLDLWQHNSNIARKHEVALWSDAHFEVIERYIASLAKLGQKSAVLIASEIPWAGQACEQRVNTPANLFEYAMVRISRETDGTFTYDFSPMERYLSLCEKYGIAQEIEVCGLMGVWGSERDGFGRLAPDYPDAIKLRYLDWATGCYDYMRTAHQIEEYIRALEAFFIDTGRIGRVRIAADEPSDEQKYRATLEHMRAIAPSFQFKAAIGGDFIAPFADDLSAFVPYIRGLSACWDEIAAQRAAHPDKVWQWYVCCGPDHPNTFIKSHLLEARFIGILTAYLGLDGFLRWNYTVWPDKPREQIAYGDWPAGDTNFVYPAANGYPLLSLRWKALRRGIDDYGLLMRLKDKKGQAAMAG
nr:DUF4091 domain-containing protein [bacterium]